MGFNNILKKIFGDQSERAVRPLWDRLNKEINPISEELTGISNDELRGRIDVIRDSIRGEAKEYKDRIKQQGNKKEELVLSFNLPLPLALVFNLFLGRSLNCSIFNSNICIWDN